MKKIRSHVISALGIRDLRTPSGVNYDKRRISGNADLSTGYGMGTESPPQAAASSSKHATARATDRKATQ